MWTRLRSGEVERRDRCAQRGVCAGPKLGTRHRRRRARPVVQAKGRRRALPRARDMAIFRAHRVQGTCVLGSATPSLESELLVRTSKARTSAPHATRAQRCRRSRRSRSSICVVFRQGPTGDKRISLPLHRALEKTLKSEEQAILFLNRRGFSPSVRCSSCGHLLSCPDCSRSR